MEVSAQIRKFVIENFLFEDNGSLNEDTSFLENGIIDSTGVLELIEFLERSFDIKVEDDEIIPENLDSISRVAAFVRGKMGVSTTNQVVLN
jgi:acyl carrier protein